MATRPRRRPADAGEHRQARINLRLSTAELAELQHAAERTGETPAGYTARVALMTARGQHDGADPAEVRELAHLLIQIQAQLHRSWSLLDQAAMTANSDGRLAIEVSEQPCRNAWRRTSEAVDAVTEFVRQQRSRHD
jgi:hypothetical protein